jgi:hypothetical protein
MLAKAAVKHEPVLTPALQMECLLTYHRLEQHVGKVDTAMSMQGHC